MKLAKYCKEPGERKRYTLDYSEWLDTNETITAVTFGVTPSEVGGVQVDAFSIGTPATSITFFVNDGLDGTTYTVEATITTSGGQIKEDQVLFAVREA